MNTKQQLDRAEAHATATAALQPRGQYPALMARIEALEAAVDRLIVVIEKLAEERP
jgi:hypothetical protein